MKTADSDEWIGCLGCIGIIVLLVALYYFVVYVVIPAFIIAAQIAAVVAAVATVIGIALGCIVGIVCYGASITNNVFSSTRGIAKVVGVVTILGVIVSAGSAGYCAYSYYNGDFEISLPSIDYNPPAIMQPQQLQQSSQPTAVVNQPVSLTPGNKLTIDGTERSLPYSTEIKFGTGYSEYEYMIEVSDVKPVVEIEFEYDVSKANPSKVSGFEVIVFDSSGRRISQDGYGFLEDAKGGYTTTKKSSTVKLLSSGDYIISMHGENMIVDITIRG